MQAFDPKSIRLLLQDPNLTIEDLLDREDFSSDVRNQSPQLLDMLNYENLKKVMEWLVKEGPQQNKQSYKFPLVASQVISMDLPNINEFFFTPEDNNQPLFQYLFKFTDEKDNYVLAGYFSKVMIAIIKRHSNPQSKYNDNLCQYFFEKQYLSKLIKHLYSRSIIDLILRIFGLRTLTNQYYQQKKKFVSDVIEMMEKQQFTDEIVQNIVFFVEALTNYQNNNQKACEDVQEIIYEDRLMKIIFQSLGASNRIRKSKAKIVNIYLKKLKSNQEYVLHKPMIENYLSLISEYISKKAKDNSKVTLEQTYIIDNLETIIVFYFNSLLPKIINCLDALFDLILCNMWNNIFHQQILKIVNLLTSKSPSKQLVTKITSNLLKFQSVQAKHLNQEVGYSEFIMKISQKLMDLYTTVDIQRSKQWIQFSQGIKEMLEVQKEYMVGDYMFKPHTIAFVYSKQMALKQYSQFLSTPTIIVYETKQDYKKQKELGKSEKQISNEKQDEKKVINQQSTQKEESFSCKVQLAQIGQQKIKQINEQYLVQKRPVIQVQSVQNTIGQSESQDSTMLQYWRNHIHYSLQDLMNDV